MNFYENIVVCNAGFGKLMIPACSNVLTHDAVYGEDRVHANQKPVPLATEITQRLTMIGDLVLDSTCGSGALLAGAASKGRRVAGCDSNENIIPIALGLITKYRVAAPSSDNRKVHDGEMETLGRVGVDDFSEVEGEE